MSVCLPAPVWVLVLTASTSFPGGFSSFHTPSDGDHVPAQPPLGNAGDPTPDTGGRSCAAPGVAAHHWMDISLSEDAPEPAAFSLAQAHRLLPHWVPGPDYAAEWTVSCGRGTALGCRAPGSGLSDSQGVGVGHWTSHQYKTPPGPFLEQGLTFLVSFFSTTAGTRP